MEHRGWRSRGYLPHCDGADRVQHIIMRTAGDDDDEIAKHFGLKLLANDAAAEVVQKALLHFDGERYALWAWCVMPNHVHVIIRQVEGWPLHRLVHSWKSFTANQINGIHKRVGAVWQREYFDRFMRDNDDLSTAIAYVEANPVKAGLVTLASDWRWSSAYLK